MKKLALAAALLTSTNAMADFTSNYRMDLNNGGWAVIQNAARVPGHPGALQVQAYMVGEGRETKVTFVMDGSECQNDKRLVTAGIKRSIETGIAMKGDTSTVMGFAADRMCEMQAYLDARQAEAAAALAAAPQCTALAFTPLRFNFGEDLFEMIDPVICSDGYRVMHVYSQTERGIVEAFYRIKDADCKSKKRVAIDVQWNGNVEPPRPQELIDRAIAETCALKVSNN